MALSTVPVDVDDVAPAPEPDLSDWDAPAAQHLCTVCAKYQHHSHGDDPWQHIGVCVECLMLQAHIDLCSPTGLWPWQGRRVAA